MKLKIAACQFPISADVPRNLTYLTHQMRAAKARGAGVAHFPETCLSGYAGADFDSFTGFDWDLLLGCTRRVMALARELKLWVVFGSSHRLSGSHKPHNSLYIVDSRGRLVDRYDKMFCTGDRAERTGDLQHYSPGSHLSTFTINEIRCAALICHDFRYQELYREYKRRDVQVVFHSYYNGGVPDQKYQSKGSILGTIVPATMQAYAANNYFWISACNTSRRQSSWPSFFVQPDGRITGRLARNRAGILMSDVETRRKFYDASEAWRDRALQGIYHSGTLVKDPRSTDSTSL